MGTADFPVYIAPHHHHPPLALSLLEIAAERPSPTPLPSPPNPHLQMEQVEDNNDQNGSCNRQFRKFVFVRWAHQDLLISSPSRDCSYFLTPSGEAAARFIYKGARSASVLPPGPFQISHLNKQQPLPFLFPTSCSRTHFNPVAATVVLPSGVKTIRPCSK